jgi:hypothetical protein
MLRKLAPAAALALAMVMPATAWASTPAIYHTISGTFASAYFTTLDGCLQTEVWISTSVAKYAPQPGVPDRLNKQGLTSISVLVYDTCQPPAGKHFPLVADWWAQTSDRLVAEPRLRGAHLDAVLPMVDSISGATADVPVHLTWRAMARAHPDTVRNNHVRFLGEGIVNTHDNNMVLPAMAWGSITLNGLNVASGTDDGASLEQVKSACMEIRYPHWAGETYYCFGF